MDNLEHNSDTELEDCSKITDQASCLDYLKRREVFLYKMMNDPSHKAMLYFLEVLMNSESSLTIDQLAAKFTNKSFTPEMQEACGGGTTEALQTFLQKYPSLFTIKPSGLVSAVAVDIPAFDEISETSGDFENFFGSSVVPSPTGKSQTRDILSPRHDRLGNTNSKKVDFDTQSSLIKRPSLKQTNHFPNDHTTTDKLNTKPFMKNPAASANTRISFGTEQDTVRNREFEPVGIYQPPIFRNGALKNMRPNSYCEFCSVAALNACSHVANTTATTVVHCPFVDLSCPHSTQKYPVTFNHPHSPHCCCAAKPANENFAPFCWSCIKLNKPICSHNLMTMENFNLETEAVKFFKQRLSKREEHWVPIKSLAGHLSQASAEVRYIVGPQLEFQNFLLKHPHVFEVQGDLVGLKDSYFSSCLSKKPKSFMYNANSLSSNSLAHTNNQKYANQKICRPKSLIMLPQSSSYVSTNYSGRLKNPSYMTPGVDTRMSSIDNSNFISTTVPTISTSKVSLSNSNPNLSYDQKNHPNKTQLPFSDQSSKCAENSKSFAQHSIQQNYDVSSTFPQSSINENETQDYSASDKYSLYLGGSICLRMCANEYRAIMFLRKVLNKKGGAPGERGLSYAQLMQIISLKASEPVQSVIGWTKIELEEFILQHSIFFEVREEMGKINNDSEIAQSSNEHLMTYVNNKSVVKMINIVITSNQSAQSASRTLTNVYGRVFHVAKLWGIIDLGKHEHVFFDKSIFKYVDDLQKHFRVDEMLYFNALLAPKGSRAKWRATQVWKECDKEIMEKWVSPSYHKTILKVNNSEAVPTIKTAVNSVDSHKPFLLLPNGSTKLSKDVDSEYGLADDEEVADDEERVSAIAREAGLDLVNDIKFLSDDVEEELERLLGPHEKTTTSRFLERDAIGYELTSYASDEDTSLTGCIEDISIRFSDESKQSFSDANSEQASNRVTSSTKKKTSKSGVQPAGYVNERSSIAVQTLSTGEIMATQIFHDVV